ERGVNALGDEAKLRAALHLERRARVMREDEHGRVVRWLLAPPAAPALVGPGPAHRPEHIAPEDPRADASKALLRHGVVGPRLALAQVLHLAPEARGEEPLHQLGTAHAERVLQTLVRPGAEAVDGDREALHAEFGHQISPTSAWLGGQVAVLFLDTYSRRARFTASEVGNSLCRSGSITTTFVPSR